MSFGEPLMADTKALPATTRIEANAERWWASWREQYLDARSYGQYDQTSWTARLFKKHLKVAWLLFTCVFGLIANVVAMTIGYISDEVVAPWLRRRRVRRIMKRELKKFTRAMVHSDLE